jgi:hypothetical protein
VVARPVGEEGHQQLSHTLAVGTPKARQAGHVITVITVPLTCSVCAAQSHTVAPSCSAAGCRSFILYARMDGYELCEARQMTARDKARSDDATICSQSGPGQHANSPTARLWVGGISCRTGSTGGSRPCSSTTTAPTQHAHSSQKL